MGLQRLSEQVDGTVGALTAQGRCRRHGVGVRRRAAKRRQRAGAGGGSGWRMRTGDTGDADSGGGRSGGAGDQ